MSTPRKTRSLKSPKPIHFSRSMLSPLGPLTLIASEVGLAAIDFRLSETQDQDPTLLEAEKQLSEYFAGKRRDFDLPLDLRRGTPFQQRAWLSLSRIPFGSYRSYKEQAALLGMSKGFRAVGAANGKNPLPIVLPCHRVIAAAGHLHGYSGGLSIKKTLLELEGVLCPDFRVSHPLSVQTPV